MAFGRIPQSFIDDVLLRTDIVDLVDSRVKLKKSGRNYVACCPFHQEKSPSFTVSREKQFYYCFGCGASGNALSFLMDYERLGFIDGLRQLAGQSGLELPDTSDGDSTPRESWQELYDTLEAAAQFYEAQLRHASQRQRCVSYLKGRGVTGQIAKVYRLGYAPPGWDNLSSGPGQALAVRERMLTTGLLVRKESTQSVYDAMRDRVIFPIRDIRGRVIAFGGRVLNDEKPKYLNSPESPVFHKGQELYGLYEARQATRKLERVVVVEGYMDVVALAQFGISYAVATLGTATSTTHIERLFRLVPEIIFCFDGDAAGRKAAWRALESALPALQDGKQVSFLFLPDDEDPDSLVRKEGPALFEARLRSQSESLANFMFRGLGEDLRLDTIEGRARLANEAKPLLAAVPEGVYREMLLGELATRSGLELERLRTALLETRPLAPTIIRETPAYTSPVTGFRPAATPISRPRRSDNRPVRLGLTDQIIQWILQGVNTGTDLQLEHLLPLLPPDDELLRELVHYLQENPGMRLHTLLLVWHDTPHQDRLGRLAAEFLVAHDNSQQFLGDLMKNLEILKVRRQIDDLHQQLAVSPDLAALRRLTELKTLEQQLSKGLPDNQTG